MGYVILAEAHFTAGEIAIVVALISTIVPTIIASRNHYELRTIHRKVTVPNREWREKPLPRRRYRLHKLSEPGETIGTEVALLREDIYALGRLLGSHILDHEEFGDPEHREFRG